jgi:NADH-quinone oxidoreductase subunit E
VYEHLVDKLKIEDGEVTPDGKFSLLKVECLGSCGTAPVVQINDDYYEDVTIKKLDQILADLK